MIVLKIFGFLILLVVGIIAYRVGKVLWFVKKMKDNMLSQQFMHQKNSYHTSERSKEHLNASKKSSDSKVLETQQCSKCGLFMSHAELTVHQCD
jgi:hypothetical protein